MEAICTKHLHVAAFHSQNQQCVDLSHVTIQMKVI